MSRWLVLPLGVMLACGDDDPTQVMVRILADSVVADAGGTLAISVYDDSDELLERLERVVGEDGDYPYVIALAPREQDSTRTWRVEAVLSGSTAGTISQRAMGAYAPGRVVVYDMLLSARCAEVTCGDEETCVAGSCRSSEVVPEELPDYTGPGDGVVDAGERPTDAGMDAETDAAEDAGEDSGEDSGNDSGDDDAGEDAGEDASDDAGEDAGEDAGTDAGPCGAACEPEPCFNPGTVMCMGADMICERPTTFRTSGMCGVGTCIMEGYCVIDHLTRNNRPTATTPPYATDEYFAEWIAMSGPRVITGTPRATLTGLNQVGRVAVFREAADSYAHEVELSPPDARLEGDEFGRGVALDGDRAVVYFRGGFVVYQRDPDLSNVPPNFGWEQLAYVPAIPGNELEGPLDLSGSYLAAAADDGLLIYERNGMAWDLQTPDMPSCTSVSDVAIDGGLIAVGCSGDTVQIYGRSAGGAWSQRTEISGAWLDFGFSVDIREGTMPDRPTLLVGALGFIFSTDTTDGRAFFYEMGATPASWNLRAELVPRDHVIEDVNRFAIDVRILDDGRPAVSAPEMFWGRGPGAPWPGAVFIFDRDPLGNYIETLRFTSARRVDRERFGDALATSGDRIAVTANDLNSALNNGAFYVFDVDGP